jgi:hypothetical protein
MIEKGQGKGKGEEKCRVTACSLDKNIFFCVLRWKHNLHIVAFRAHDDAPASRDIDKEKTGDGSCC